MSPANIFAVLIITVSFLSFLPKESHAVYNQADMQCPPGGQVAQPCKDVTNGYTTSGHCTFIGVCKADNFPPPPKADPEQHSSPVGSDKSAFGGSGTTSSSASSTYSQYATFMLPLDSDPSQWSAAEVIAAAYQRAQSIPAVDGSGGVIDSYIKFLDFQGTTYLVTPSEILKVGAELQPAPSGTASGGSASIPVEFNTEAFRSFAGLYPDLVAHSVIHDPKQEQVKVLYPRSSKV
jgi:hypothetical protein